MIRKILPIISALLLISTVSGFGQNFFYAVANGAWNVPTTWAGAPGGAAGSGGDGSGTDTPGAGDFVLTEGFSITVGSFFTQANEVCTALLVAFNTPNSIISGSLLGASSVEVQGVMAGYDPGTQGPMAPTASILQQSPNLNFIFSGTGIVLNFWSTAAPFL